MEGIVFDAGSKLRLARVYIYNTRTNKGIFNNSKGEFRGNASKGDTLVAALEGYFVDTATISNQNAIVFYLKRKNIQLKEVTVRKGTASPQKKYKTTKEEYQDIYRKGNAKDIFTVGAGANGLGVGLSIDALYNLLSREGKNARFLQEIIERDYRDAIIDYRFNETFVGGVTGFEGGALADFMQQYRPSYHQALQYNDYSMLGYIKESVNRYRQNPTANRLPALKEAEE